MKLYKIVITLCLLVIGNKSNAQNKSLLIKGTLADAVGNEIQNCYIKISNAGNSLILAYVNTGNSSKFNISIKTNIPDSIIVEVSNISFDSYQKKIIISEEDSVNLTVVLFLKTKTLDSVKINAPPIWVRGDTTFFKANRFKEGDEKNLKDLILKLPGFETDANNNLLYKRKRVEKIFIDGEDIFSDQIKLMINNFPLHVINTIQALENQNDDKILKGLKNDNKVFLNIGLQKNKALHAFGSGEIGLGTANRYLLKPIIFSLYRKIKLGYIGSINSIGDGIDWREDRSLKLDEAYELEPWQLNSKGLVTIGNFKNNRYITNQRFSNNFQINLPAKKKFKSRILATLLADKQKQQSFYTSSIYNDSVYLNRKDTNSIINKPLLVKISQIMEWQKNENNLLKTTLRFYKDFSTNQQASIYRQTTQKDYAHHKIKNDWLALAAQFEFTKRVNSNKGYKITGLVNLNQFAQFATSQSATLPQIFQVPNTYDRLIQLPNLKNKNASIAYELNFKQNKKLHQLNLYSKWQQFNFSRNLYLNSSESHVKDTSIAAFKNKGVYDVFSINSLYRYSKKLGNVYFQFNPAIGYLKTLIREDHHSHSQFNYPLYNLSTVIKKTFSYKFNTTLITGIEQVSPEKYRYSNINLPQSIEAFKKSLQGQQPLKIFSSTANIIYAGHLHQLLYHGTFSLSFNRQYRNLVMKNSLDHFMQLAIDSFANIPLNQINIFNSYSFNKKNGVGNYTIGGAINFNKGLLKINNQIVKSNITWAYYYTTARYSWQKKYFINLNYYQFFSTITYPANLNLNRYYNPSMRIELMQRLFLFKKINFIVNTEYYNGNLNAKNKSSLFFIDAEVNMNLPKQKLQLSLKADNLTNKKYYYSNRNSLLSQSTFHLPIVKRNIYFSAKYNL